MLHHQDPTQLLLKELTGNVVRSGDGCILLGEYSVYEENLKLEQSTAPMRDGTADRLPHFFCDLLVSTSGAIPRVPPSVFSFCALTVILVVRLSSQHLTRNSGHAGMGANNPGQSAEGDSGM